MKNEVLNWRRTAVGMLESGQYFKIGKVEFEYMLTMDQDKTIMCRMHQDEIAYVYLAATQIVTVYY